MIVVIVKQPVRAKYADEWPSLVEEFTDGDPGRAGQHLVRLVPQRGGSEPVDTDRGVPRPRVGGCPCRVGSLQDGDGADAAAGSLPPRRSSTSRSPETAGRR